MCKIASRDGPSLMLLSFSSIPSFRTRALGSFNHSCRCFDFWLDAYSFTWIQHKRPAMVYLRHPSSSTTTSSSGKGFAKADGKASADKGHIPRGLEYIPSGQIGLLHRKMYAFAMVQARRSRQLKAGRDTTAAVSSI